MDKSPGQHQCVARPVGRGWRAVPNPEGAIRVHGPEVQGVSATPRSAVQVRTELPPPPSHEVRVMARTLHIQPKDFGADVDDP